ncbi:MAG: hypothetical protein FD167_5650, partial [bacterium]
VLNYIQQHQGNNPELAKLHKSLISEIKRSRWTRTQIYNLKGDCPKVVNIYDLHPGIDIPTGFEVIDFPELPRRQGYIQEVDDRTGLPTKVGGDTPHPNYGGAFFNISPDLDVVAVIRTGLFGMNLDLCHAPSYTHPNLGLRLVRNTPELEVRVR